MIAGLQSEYCVRATTLTALARGHRVTLASGAHGTYPEQRSPAEISAAVERELAAAGATVTPFGETAFG